MCVAIELTEIWVVQGQMWKIGYEAGVLKGALFSDVPDALKQWTQQGLRVSQPAISAVLYPSCLLCILPALRIP